MGDARKAIEFYEKALWIVWDGRRDYKKEKGWNNMKCALCGREIKGKDYIRVNTPDQKGIHWSSFKTTIHP